MNHNVGLEKLLIEMNSRKGGGKQSSASFSAPGGGGSYHGLESGTADQLSHGVQDMGLESSQEGEWEVIGRKSKNRSNSAASRPSGSSNNASKAWTSSEGQKQGWGANGGSHKTGGNSWAQASEGSYYHKPVGRGGSKMHSTIRGWESAYVAPPPNVPPPLHNGWQWATRVGAHASQPKAPAEPCVVTDEYDGCGKDDEVSDDDDKIIDDSDDYLSDDYDSDASQKSHETRKKNTWFKAFFEDLERLTVEELNDLTRQWHCPACHNGPGAIDWYKGLLPLLTHAKTKGSSRVRLHRELAALLEEELLRRGTSAIPPSEGFGKWRGLRETTTDHEIVWPPMVVVMNTQLDKDEKEKWIGMGNQELLEYFSGYAAVKARHAYGPRGHRGMSVLIFEENAIGYLEAERLHKHFADQGTDRDAWERRRVPFYPGGKRQLYGYLARKEDMDVFNQHCQGKSRIKFDMRSYQEKVVIPMRQMSEDNQQLNWMKNSLNKHKKHSKVLQETVESVSEKLRQTIEENKIVRLRTQKQHEQHKEEMQMQEQWFNDQMDNVHKATEEKERMFEQLLQEERAKAKAKESDMASGTNDDQRLGREATARFIDSQVKDVQRFEAEREDLIQAHEDKKLELRKKHLAEEVELEKEFDAALTKLMEKFAPSSLDAPSSS